MANDLESLADAHRKGLRADQMRFRADIDLLQIEDAVVRQGDDIKKLLRLLNLRKNRAETLTRRIHLLFCALAAARVHRVDGWVSVDEIGHLEGWSGSSSVAKLLINEFELGSGALGVFEQKGRGGDAQLRLRMPPRMVDLGELPAGVLRLFVQERRSPAPPEDVQPRSVRQWDFAMEVAGALRTACPGRTMLVWPLYQGGGREVGNHSLVFGGLEIRPIGATAGQPAAMSVVVKLPIGLNAGKSIAIHQDALDDEIQLAAGCAGWPGLPTRVDAIDVDLRFAPRAQAELHDKHGIQLRSEGRTEVPRMKALVVPLGHPRTVEAEPRLLRSVIDGMASSPRRLTRRDVHNVLILADRLATMTRMLHRKRRAHRHLSVDAIVLRYELGIIEEVLAADLAASVEVPAGNDDLLFGDLFDLGRVLTHLITGWRLSEARQDFEPPFPGRENIKNAVVGEGETVARLLFAVSRYLLEASSGDLAAGPDAPATVGLLDQFLYEIQHAHMLHWSRARGVPERRVSSGTGDAAPASDVMPHKDWPRSAADPVATRLVTISHLVDPLTLQRWCERYITSFAWHESMPRPGEMVGDGPVAVPSAKRCIAILQQGFGRSAAHEMWKYLWNAPPDEPAEDWLRVLRNYVTHWTREQRFDAAHRLGTEAPDQPILSHGLFDELHHLRSRIDGRSEPEAELIASWLDELNRRTWDAGEREAPGPDAGDPERPRPARGIDDRLRSWMHAGALVRLLRTRAVPSEKDIYDVEIALRGRSSPETVFWHILLARAWVSAAAHGVKTEDRDGESGWDKAMRTLLVAAGVAASRKLPFEMAGTLAASAYLARTALGTPELRKEFIAQGADEDSVRVQAAECALTAADAYLWLDNQRRHCRSILEAVWLLLGCAFPERLVQASQLLALARNNRLLDWHPPQIPDPRDPGNERFERYDEAAADRDARAARLTRLEHTLFDELHRSWIKARKRGQPDDPGTAMTHGYFARYAPGIEHVVEASAPSLELDGTSLLELAHRHFNEPSPRRVLDLGCGPGDEARRLARRGHEVWAVDAPVWFAASGAGPTAGEDAPAPVFVQMDPLEYAGRLHDDARAVLPAPVDAVVFRCALSRISQRGALLAAAYKALRPGGLVVSIEWVQTRTTDRITWSRLLGTLRLVDVETAIGYRRLSEDAGFTDFHAWDARDAPMHRYFQQRLDATIEKLEDERSDVQRSPYERAALLRSKRDLEVLTAMARPRGPFEWLFWAARRR